MLARLALSLALLLPALAQAEAEPTVREKTDLYDLNGTTAEAVRQQVREKGPKAQGDRRFVGRTTTNVRYRFNYALAGDVCRVTSVATEVDVTFAMPQWVDRERADAVLQQKWDTFIAALWLHERGHRDIGVAIAVEIERELSGLGQIKNGECGIEFRDLAQAQARLILDQIQLRHNAYDRDTGHGRTQGAGVLFE